MYRYHTGEDVLLGDNIFYPGLGKGYVSYILPPKTQEAISWGIPDGAVIGGFGDSDMSISFAHPEEEEDLELLCRGTSASELVTLK